MTFMLRSKRTAVIGAAALIATAIRIANGKAAPTASDR
jgi:hypothetical protein